MTSLSPCFKTYFTHCINILVLLDRSKPSNVEETETSHHVHHQKAAMKRAARHSLAIAAVTVAVRASPAAVVPLVKKTGGVVGGLGDSRKRNNERNSYERRKRQSKQ